MIETAARLTDEALDLRDGLIGSFFTKSKFSPNTLFLFTEDDIDSSLSS